MPAFAIIGGLIIAVILYWIIALPRKEDKQAFDQWDRDRAENQRIMREFFSKPSVPPVNNIYHVTQTPQPPKKDLPVEDIDAEII